MLDTDHFTSFVDIFRLVMHGYCYTFYLESRYEWKWHRTWIGYVYLRMNWGWDGQNNGLYNSIHSHSNFQLSTRNSI